ncbi:Prophage CP4-57 regulatory protein (AlpA) [compost metagenome]
MMNAHARCEQDIEYIRLPEVKKIVGLGTTKIYAMIKEGDFPAQVNVGGRAVAWVLHEVQQWARDRMEVQRRIIRQPAANTD